MTVRLGTKLIANTSSGGTGDTNVLVDNITITKDENDIITTVAIDNKNNSSNIPAVKTWMGTLAEYEAIENKSNDVIYYITDDETLAQSANISLSNLSEEGQSKFEEKANKTDVLNKQQITNCLLEVPQNIKLELTDGVLTLKAGSELTYADGRTITVASDFSQSQGVNTTRDKLILVYDNTRTTINLGIYIQGFNATSGTTPPSIASGTVDYIWFDTNENKMKVSHDTQATWKEIPLPLGVVSVTPNTWVSIDQVFNGFGYIGSTVWVDKGVKGLIPDGRNTDGTLNNIEFVTDKILTSSAFNTNANIVEARLVYNGSNINITRNTPSSSGFYFDHISNYYIRPDGTQKTSIDVAVMSTTTNGIQSFKSKLAFRAVDYNDKSEISGWGMPSSKYINLTLGASGTIYTAPANGWFNGRFKYTAGGFYQVNTGPLTLVEQMEQGSNQRTFLVPIKKGEQFGFIYSNLQTANYTFFRFIYAESEV